MMDRIAGILLEKVVEALVKEGQSLLAFDEQFEDMKKELQYMQAFMKDAERVDPNYQTHMLHEIMSDLKESLFDADDIIADSEFRLSRQQRKCVPTFLSPSATYFRYKLGKRLQEVNHNIGKVKESMKMYLDTALRLPGPSKRESQNSSWSNPILIDENKAVGLVDDVKRITGWVLEADIPFQVIGIAGMGGVGKTTLAEKVGKNKSIIENFNCVLFVSISQQVDLKNVISNLLRKLHLDEDFRRRESRDLLEMLKGKLNGQRYLIVLDDVWGINEGWWSSLESGLPKTHGSCVIVTSRKDDVIKQMRTTAEVRIHHPEVLSVEDSWLLFSNIAFASNGGECPNPKLKDIGEKIVKKCAGLPLAIKTIGGTMLGKGYDVDEWDQMLKRLNEKSTGNRSDDLVMSRLRLSYEELPSYLKPCLLCFAAFPEDAEIEVEQITWWWVGEGFVRERDGRSAMDTGRDYFAQLLSSSLIMGVEKNEFETRYTSSKVHDIIREMLVQIAREENFIGVDDDTGRPIFSKHSRRAVNYYVQKDNDEFETSPKLRVLVNYNECNELSSTMRQKLCQLQWLRVLHLSLFGSHSYFDSDSDSEERKSLQFIMKKLKWRKMKRGQILSLRLRQVFLSLPHLVSLVIDGAGFDEIPDSIGRLHNLKILIVRRCYYLLRVSPEITTLKKLIFLEIGRCPSLECIPQGIGKLSGLRWLTFGPTNYLAHNHGCRLSELKNLTRLQRLVLLISSEAQIEEGGLNALAELSCLYELRIFCDSSVASKLDQWLSCPLHHLSYLNVWQSSGKATPTWMNPIVLPNLRFLRFCGPCIVQFSQEFWENREGTHWKLEGLILHYLPNLDEEWPRIHRAMPSLTFLSVDSCSHLKSLPFDGGKGGVWRKEEEKGKGSSGQMDCISGFE